MKLRVEGRGGRGGGWGWGREKTEYEEKIPDNELQKTPHRSTKARNFNSNRDKIGTRTLTLVAGACRLANHCTTRRTKSKLRMFETNPIFL